jgi:hypothetical protein
MDRVHASVKMPPPQPTSTIERWDQIPLRSVEEGSVGKDGEEVTRGGDEPTDGKDAIDGEEVTRGGVEPTDDEDAVDGEEVTRGGVEPTDGKDTVEDPAKVDNKDPPALPTNKPDGRDREPDAAVDSKTFRIN